MLFHIKCHTKYQHNQCLQYSRLLYPGMQNRAHTASNLHLCKQHCRKYVALQSALLSASVGADRCVAPIMNTKKITEALYVRAAVHGSNTNIIIAILRFMYNCVAGLQLRIQLIYANESRPITAHCLLCVCNVLC